MEFDLQTRLQWLDVNHIQYGQNVTVVEPSAEGEAEKSSRRDGLRIYNGHFCYFAPDRV